MEHISFLVEKLKNEKFFIYGTGYVAINFLKALKLRGVEHNLCGYITSFSDRKIINERPVYCIDDAEIDNKFVCVAVHEAVRDEIEKELKIRGIKNFIWIYPYLYELLLGDPLYEGIMVDILTIYNQNKDNLIVPIRYLAIEEYFGEKSGGYEAYLKCMELSCEAKTARNRLERFKELIHNVEIRGLDHNYPISLLENFKFIDGTHRLAMAIYLGEKTIASTIYPALVEQSYIHGLGGIITEKDILLNIGDERLVEKLFDARDRIRTRINNGKDM